MNNVKWMVWMIAGLLVMPFSSACAASKGTESDMNLTIYQNMGLIHEVRQLQLEKGSNILILNGLAKNIETGSLRLDFDGTIRVVESLSNESFWDKMLRLVHDEPIQLMNTASGEILTGNMVDFKNGRLLLKQSNGKQLMIYDPDQYALIVDGDTFLPDESASVRVTADAPETRNYNLNLHYQSPQINWRADYAFMINEDKGTAKLVGMASIRNNSGTTFDMTNIHLVAGQVYRGGQARPMHMSGEMMTMSASADTGVEPNRMSDFYVYRFDETYTLVDRGTLQLPLIQSDDVDFLKEYCYTARPFGHTSKEFRNAVISYSFENKQEHGLGVPLASGQARVYLAESYDGMVRDYFGGQDQIRNIPIGESFSLVTGESFDLVIEEWVDEQGQVGRIRNEQRHVNVHNRTDERKTITVEVPLRSHYQLESASLPYVDKGDYVLFELEVNAGESKEIRMELSSR